MTRRPCQICGHPSDGYACSRCARDYEKRLCETPWLVNELATALTRQTRYGNRVGSSAVGKTRPLPLDLRASAAQDQYRRTLGATAHLLHPGTTRRSALEYARLLLTLDAPTALRFRADGPDHMTDTARAFKAGRRVVDRPAERWFAGPCVTCERDLYADPGKPAVTCACGATYDVQTRRDYLLTEAEDQLANAVTIARAVSWLGAEPLTAARVRQWAHRGRLRARAHVRCSSHAAHLTPPDDCRSCSPLYRVGDAIDLLARDTNQKERS